MWIKLLRVALFCMTLGVATHGKAETLKLYIDADYSTAVVATQSIELGVRTALSEVEYSIDGTTLEVVPMDHHGNVKRSHHNMKTYLQDSAALVLVGGIHSPPYITHRDFMNANEILTLLPWSAAGPITRAAEGHQNWIFRLSVDDYQSGEFLVRQAVNHNKCERLALVLLDSGWGRVNETTLTNALSNRNLAPSAVQFFPSSVGPARARQLANDVLAADADCAVLLAGAKDGGVIVEALYETVPTIRLFSHWGILGGGFADVIPHAARQSLQISVLQTCGLRVESNGSDVLRHALSQADTEVRTLAELPAPTGFVHGYDLTRVLIMALKQAKADARWQDSTIVQKRAMVRDALAALKAPVQGILRTYNPPFSAYSKHNTDGHEALGLDDLCIAQFREDGRLADAR